MTAVRIQLHRNAPSVVMHTHTILASQLQRWLDAGWEHAPAFVEIPSLPGDSRTLVCCYGDPRLPTPDELEARK
jgi:hypothetical protein